MEIQKRRQIGSKGGKIVKQETREKKFKCPNGIEHATGYKMDCYFYGCVHQINDTCPVIRGEDERKKT